MTGPDRQAVAPRPAPHAVTAAARLAFLGVTLVLGCLEIPVLRRPDDAAVPDVREAPALAVTAVVIESVDGRRWPATGIPRQPRVAVLFAAAPAASLPVYLLAGGIDDELTSDLGASPLRSSTLERVIDAEVTALGERVVLVPRSPLEAGADLVLAIGAWAHSGARTLGAPHLVSLHVSTDPALGARVTDAWPPDGASGIGPTVPMLAVRFDGTVEIGPGALALYDERGATVDAVVRSARCEEIGWSGPSCAVLEPSSALAPDTVHELRLGDARDGTGAAVPPFVAQFKTASRDDGEPPVLAAFECALDEQTLGAGAGCLLVDDRSLDIRIRGIEPLRLALDTAGGRVRAVLSRGEGAIGLAGLGAGTTLDAVLLASDASGLTTRVDFAVTTPPPLPELAIVEVRADPLGREPTQEYVELENRGATLVDLAGLFLADGLGSTGDELPPLVVPAGGRVLVVADAFDPDDDRDVPVPPGVPLARVDGSLGSGGLASYGEPLFLRDAEHHRLSAAPALPARAGVCIVRVIADARSGAPSAFGYDPAGTCSPGTE